MDGRTDRDPRSALLGLLSDIFVHILNFSEKYFTKRDGVVEEMEETSGKLKKDEEEDFGPGKFAKYQKLMWDLIEKPDTSLAAK